MYQVNGLAGQYERKVLDSYESGTSKPAASKSELQRLRAAARNTRTHASVSDALADTPDQAANLRVRAELMQKIAAIVKTSGWSQADAAKQCGITEPRINEPLRGRLSRFTLDALVNIATAIGQRVHVQLEPVQSAVLLDRTAEIAGKPRRF